MTPKITEGFSSGDDEKVVSILNKWNGGTLSNALFYEIARITPQVSAIIVIFRKNKEKTEVLLLPRPDDDPVWPNFLNLPGKMFRVPDFDREDGNPMNGPIERIENSELHIKLKERPKFAEIVFQNTKRGPVVALVHIGQILDDTKSQPDWIWADVTKLKELKNFLESETSAIEVALKHYLASSNHLPSL